MNTRPRGFITAGVLGASLLLFTAGTAFAAGPTGTLPTPSTAPGAAIAPGTPNLGPSNMMNGQCTDGRHVMNDRAMAILEFNDVGPMRQYLDGRGTIEIRLD